VSDEAIFCARCGAAGQKVESYCRSCGEWLADPSPAWHPRAKLRRLSPERKRLKVRILQLLSALAAGAAGFIALTVRDGSDPDLLTVAALLCFLVVAWQAVGFLIGLSIEGKRDRGSAEGGQALPAAAQGDARSALKAADTADLVRPQSVTENTTALLDPVPAKKAGKK
jgi:hypothetical protein